MTIRHNLCPNPALKNNATGWTGGATRTAVTGFLRSFSARYSTGSFMTMPVGAASPGLTYTASVYIRPNGVALIGGTLALFIQRSAGGDVSAGSSTSLAGLPADTVTRISLANVTVTDAATTGIYLQVSGIAFSTRPCDFTALLLEPVSALDAYFDGDTSGATWDGTSGNSASTLVGTHDATVSAATTASLTSSGVVTGIGASGLGVTTALGASGAVTAAAAATLGTTANLATIATVVTRTVKATSTAAVTARRTSTDLVTARRTSTAAVTAKRTSSGGVS